MTINANGAGAVRPGRKSNVCRCLKLQRKLFLLLMRLVRRQRQRQALRSPGRPRLTLFLPPCSLPAAAIWVRQRTFGRRRLRLSALFQQALALPRSMAAGCIVGLKPAHLIPVQSVREEVFQRNMETLV